MSLRGESPIQESEILTAEQVRDEAIMLGIRMRAGISTDILKPEQLKRLTTYEEEGFLNFVENRVQLSPTGRLIADRIVREVTI